MLSRRGALQVGLGFAALGARPGWAADKAGPKMPAKLVAAAKKEGAINTIALPRDWANWGATMDRFQELYGIKLTNANPDGSSAEELQAVRSLKGQSRAPDVLDLGPSFAIAGKREKLLQPYKVAEWKSIPDDVKDAEGYWYGDYFGVEAFAVNTGVAKSVPVTWGDLKKPEYKGMVALNGNPLGAGAAFSAVFAASLANGGSYDDIEPGIEFFGELAKLGNLNPAAATPGSLISGQTPIVINWDYLGLGYKKSVAEKATIEVQVPKEAAPFGNFYASAISAHAPHPEAAKLWMEYVYSDEGQIAFLEGFAHPIRFNALVAADKIPPAIMNKLPPAEAYKDVKFATPEQTAAAQKKLQDMWPRVVKL